MRYVEECRYGVVVKNSAQVMGVGPAIVFDKARRLDDPHDLRIDLAAIEPVPRNIVERPAAHHVLVTPAKAEGRSRKVVRRPRRRKSPPQFRLGAVETKTWMRGSSPRKATPYLCAGRSCLGPAVAQPDGAVERRRSGVAAESRQKCRRLSNWTGSPGRAAARAGSTRASLKVSSEFGLRSAMKSPSAPGSGRVKSGL